MTAVGTFHVTRIEESESVRSYGGRRVGEARVRVEASDGENDVTFHALATEWVIGEPVEVTVAKVDA